MNFYKKSNTEKIKIITDEVYDIVDWIISDNHNSKMAKLTSNLLNEGKPRGIRGVKILF